jgi:hypothetical protein
MTGTQIGAFRMLVLSPAALSPVALGNPRTPGNTTLR